MQLVESWVKSRVYFFVAANIMYIFLPKYLVPIRMLEYSAELALCFIRSCFPPFAPLFREIDSFLAFERVENAKCFRCMREKIEGMRGDSSYFIHFPQTSHQSDEIRANYVKSLKPTKVHINV